MVRSKSKNEVTHLKGVIKQLEKEIKRLKKREYNYLDLEEREASIAIEEDVKEKLHVLQQDLCPQCNGKVDIIDGTRIKVFICSECTYRVSKRV